MSCLGSMHLHLLQNFHCILSFHLECHLSKFHASSSFFHIRTIFCFSVWVNKIFMFFSIHFPIQRNIFDGSKFRVALISSLVCLHKLELYVDICREMLYSYRYTEEVLVTRSSPILPLSFSFYAIRPFDCLGIRKTCL